MTKKATAATKKATTTLNPIPRWQATPPDAMLVYVGLRDGAPAVEVPSDSMRTIDLFCTKRTAKRSYKDVTAVRLVFHK